VARTQPYNDTISEIEKGDLCRTDLGAIGGTLDELAATSRHFRQGVRRGEVGAAAPEDYGHWQC
jgi:hypothetical protein